MLPPGHIAAGYLTGLAFLQAAHPVLSETQTMRLLWWSAFCGFAPDLDMFYYFARNRTWLVAGENKARGNHRYYLSHAPALWLAAGLLVYAASGSAFGRALGLLLWLGSWSHFLLDSIDYGIMWLWPFSKTVYSLRRREVLIQNFRTGFVSHTWEFLKGYARTLTFYAEAAILIAAGFTLFK
ncbi:MAG TPA: metal-dependent hydrolase [Patescibacteria group bacterium]|nr:metal-dependent hydrolase [Patescibacteria group bacterium]